MPGYWIRTTRLTACTSLRCSNSMVRDEPVYLAAGTERNVVCRSCAKRRFEKEPPATLPHLPPLVAKMEPRELPAQQLTLRDSIEQPEGAFERFNRAQVGGTVRDAIKKNQQQLRQANAIDPKLRQVGGDR